MTTKQKIPAYRFKDYDGEWEEKKLGEITERVQGNDGRMELPTLTISAAGGWLDQRDRFSANIAGKEQVNYTLLRRGELSYNHGNSKLAKYGVVKELKTFGEALVPKVYHSFRVLSQSSSFIEYLLGTKIPDRELGKLVTSGARMDGLLNISYAAFAGIVLSLPTLPEQSAIGSFFADLDRLISLHQDKLDTLKEQKKTYLKLLFPAKDQKVPALRFAGFTDEWEQVKLGEIAELYQPQTITGNELLSTGVPVFGANGYIGYYSKSNHDLDQVTISARGEGTGTPNYVKGPVWITGNSMVVNIDENRYISKYFLFSLFLSFNFKIYVTGGAQPQLTREVLEKIKFSLPTLPEQEVIGTFFQTLDQEITQQESKLDSLKKMKKTLLRKMFV